MAGRDQQLMKQQLAELIEAYAAARVSGNRMLMEYAAGKLNELMASIEVAVPKEILEATKTEGQ
jgi:purine nucleoside phosphorylase